jgi:hypothetical protein
MMLTMQGALRDCILLTYRTPARSVEDLVPPGLELVRHGDFAFWNVVLCRVEKMRPEGMPKFLGITYYHVAYRLLVKARLAGGKELRGLFFARSDASSSLIALGGALTDFRFQANAVDLQERRGEFIARVAAKREAIRPSSGYARLRCRRKVLFELEPDSCFDTIENARQALKYTPRGLAVSRDGRRLRVAEVERDETRWMEWPLAVEQQEFLWLRGQGQTDLKLELATIVEPLDYQWRLGRTERLAPR